MNTTQPTKANNWAQSATASTEQRRCLNPPAFIASQGHLRWTRVGGWKKRVGVDSDPAGRKEIAKGYMIFRGVGDPEKVFVGVEFGSVEDAGTFRERLLGSGALDSPDVTVAMPPTVVGDRG